jgi:hypothetical protein
MFNFAARCAFLTRQCEKKGDGMSLFMDWVKTLFWSGVFIAASYDYYYYSGGSGVINFLMIFILIIIATFVLGVCYCDPYDSGRNKKLFWLTIYFVSPILCNWASIGLKWSGYETAAHYAFKLRYWELLKTPLLALLYLVVAKAVKKSRPQFKRARQTPMVEIESAERNAG